jgi:hypothetical protein
MTPLDGFTTALPAQSAVSADVPAAPGLMPETLRVLLSRLQITTQADIEVSGTYAMDFGGLTLLFPNESRITVLLIGGLLYVEYQGLRLGGGTALTLTRYRREDGGENGLRFTGLSTSLYEGSLSLTVKDGVIRPILSIGVEEYLLGVVPYEMSESFPLEALKAQAVAARTYAVRKAQGNAAAEYDLVDTTNDQVFKGRQFSDTRTAEAVRATAGVCAFFNGGLAMCYYGSSNGGQTELADNYWGPGGDTGYLDMRDDPYDLENPHSVVRTAVLPKAASAPEQTPYGLRALLAQTLRDTLLSQGYDVAGESLRIDTILSVTMDTPAFAAPSRLYTQFHITFTYSARTRTDPVVVTATPDTSALSDQVEVSLFTAPPATQAPALSPTLTPAETPAPTPTPEPVYGPFVPAEEAVTLTLPIFPDVEKALDLSINLYADELWTVTQTDDSFVVEARRFGHGVGMSQYGAEQMASVYGLPYTDILAFYYPGVTLMRYPNVTATLPEVSSVFTMPADPPPSPTPRPTLMPQTQTAIEGQWTAKVANIGENSWLNLRAEPNLSSEILMLLYKDQPLLVLERMPQEGWVRVKTDAAEGYVLEEFLLQD